MAEVKSNILSCKGAHDRKFHTSMSEQKLEDFFNVVEVLSLYIYLYIRICIYIYIYIHIRIYMYTRTCIYIDYYLIMVFPQVSHFTQHTGQLVFIHKASSKILLFFHSSLIWTHKLSHKCGLVLFLLGFSKVLVLE